MSENNGQASVSLSLQYWQEIITLLGSHPYNTAAPLISSIQRQVMAQLSPTPPQENAP